MHMTVISGSERRRRWSVAAREEIVSASMVPGAVVAEVARQFDVATSLIYKWRRQAQQSTAMFVPVALVGCEGSLLARAGSRLAETIARDDSEPGPEPEPLISITLGTARIDIPVSAPVPLVSAVLRALQ